MEYHENYLYHYGIPGMKWGVRHNKRSAMVKARRSSTKKKKATNKKSIKQKAKERIAKIDKQKVKDIAKTSAVILGKAAVAASLSAIGGAAAYSIINSISDAYNNANFVGPRYGAVYNFSDGRKVFGPYTGGRIRNYNIETTVETSPVESPIKRRR